MEFSGFDYTCQAGETFDSVALRVYGDEKYAAELLSANPSFSRILIFSGGEKLALPVVVAPDMTDAQGVSVTAPWKG